MGSFQLWISPLTKNDLKNILIFGKQNWGKEREKNYKNDLKQALWHLTELPTIGVQRNEIFQDLRCFGVNAHLVFYRLRGKKVEILRVLHGRQDPENYL